MCTHPHVSHVKWHMLQVLLHMLFSLHIFLNLHFLLVLDFLEFFPYAGFFLTKCCSYLVYASKEASVSANQIQSHKTSMFHKLSRNTLLWISLYFEMTLTQTKNQLKQHQNHTHISNPLSFGKNILWFNCNFWLHLFWTGEQTKGY